MKHVETPTKMPLGTCYIYIYMEHVFFILFLFDHFESMVAAWTGLEARFGTIAPPSFVAWHGSAVFMVWEVHGGSQETQLFFACTSGHKIGMFENKGCQYTVFSLGN